MIPPQANMGKTPAAAEGITREFEITHKKSTI
jgi:hypothetical protein